MIWTTRSFEKKNEKNMKWDNKKQVLEKKEIRLD